MTRYTVTGLCMIVQEPWRERSERAPNEMGLDGGTGVQCGCWVGGGAVPLCEVREERERCRVCSGSVVLGGFLGVNGFSAVARHVTTTGGHDFT